jgi:Domain of unknown function (DUF4249)
MRVIIFILIFFMMACVDPLNVKLTNLEKRLLVDGLITDQPGPYQVKLFYYTNELNRFGASQLTAATSAQVSIYDDLQNKISLNEISPGIYETDANELTGAIGRSYYLSIKTQTGIQYQSSVQKMTNPGEISNLYFEFQDEEQPKYSDALKVYIDAKGVSDKENLFRWRWTTIHTTKSRPELHTEPIPRGERPAPEPCSGYIYNGRLIKVGDCTCCICWSYNYNDGAFVSQNDYVSENQFNKQYLGMIPVTSMHFYDRYYIEIQQLSLSEEAYNFWNLAKKQQQGSTDIFQPNAIKIRGNVKSITNPDEDVLGFFGASGVAIRSLYIPVSEVPYLLPPIDDSIPFSCLDYFKNPTTEKPFFW